MPIITIQLSGCPVTQRQKDALVARSIDMVRDALHQDPQMTGVLIEERGAESWSGSLNPVIHRFRSTKEYQQCLSARWQRGKRSPGISGETDRTGTNLNAQVRRERGSGGLVHAQGRPRVDVAGAISEENSQPVMKEGGAR